MPPQSSSDSGAGGGASGSGSVPPPPPPSGEEVKKGRAKPKARSDGEAAIRVGKKKVMFIPLPTAYKYKKQMAKFAAFRPDMPDLQGYGVTENDARVDLLEKEQDAE